MKNKIILLLLAWMMISLSEASLVRASSQSLSEQIDWKAGVFSGTEAESNAGDLKLKTAGSWTQRAWQTPDIALTTGSSVVSDGSYVYAAAGTDTWFGRYNPVDNSWKTMSPLPYTAYYGSDLLYKDGYIYAIFGSYQNLFARYEIASDTWTTMANTPDLVYRGGSLATDGTDIYALRGSGTTDFWKYTIATNSWAVGTSTPATMNQGASLSYYNGYFYTPRGGNTNTYYRYDIANGTWLARTNITASINDDTNTTVRGAYIYVMLNNNTTTMYRYDIAGNSWSTMATTPQASRYVGLTYNASDDKIYVFRGNGSYDMWKYDADANSYSGPLDLQATPGSGADLVYYNGYVYQPRGNNTTTFYRYKIANNTWETLAVAPGTFNDDTTGVVAGAYLYFYRGSSTTTFYRYDPTNNVWATMSAAPATIGYGGSLAYPGSGDCIYGTRGLYTLTYYCYSISGNSWTTKTSLPNNSEASYGARLLSDGTNIYYLSGSRTGALLKYDISGDSWGAESILPYAAYWGTDAIYFNGNIYVQAGYYKNTFWKYNITSRNWTWMDSLQQNYGYDTGSYNGGSLAIDPSSGVMYSILGANILNMATFSISVNDYLASGTWTSETQDLAYVTSWTNLVETSSKPSDSSISHETRTSADATTWSSWEDVVGGSIASPVNRYIQIRSTLTADTSLTQTPTLSALTINYQGDITTADNPSSFVGKSSEIGGSTLTSGETYRHNYPYFTWSGASDNESGIAGYYVYFGTSASANPETDGNYQTNSDYVVTANLSSNTYYLIVKTKDVAGNISASTSGFTYVYQGVAYSSVSTTTTSEFDSGTLSNISTTGDQIRLSGKEGYWMESAPGLTPANLNYGSALAYTESSGKMYATRGSNSNSFYELDLATLTWSSLSNAPATVGYGGDLVEGPSGYLYAFRGINTNTFWRYDIAQNTWDDSAAEDSPQSIYYGSSLLYDGSQYIYGLRGNNDDSFLRYDTTEDDWTSLTSVDFGAVTQQVNNTVNYGADLAYDGSETIYATQGNTRTGFSAYDISSNTWSQLEKTPAAVYQGGQIEYDETSNAIYLIAGWSKPYLYKYSIDSGTWSQLPDGPYTFGLGTGMRNVGGKLYVTRATNSRYTYVYDIAKGRWLVPTRGLFGAMFQGSDIRSINYGADIVKGDNNYLYMTRGNNDNLFVRYDTTNGQTTQMAGLPSGQNTGGSLAYESTNNKIYATASLYNSNLYVYDVASNIWSSQESDPLPIDPGPGASLEYDGSRYIYYARGNGGTNFYRFDTLGTTGAKWSALAVIPAGISYGAELVYKDGYVYTMRGNNVNPNPLYRYDVNQGTWSSLTSLSSPIYNDGFLVDSGGDLLYACRGGNTTDCFAYSISNNSWSSIASAPGEIYQGGSATSDGAGKMYVLFGTGTNAFNNGLYTYVMESATTSVEETGSYESATIDLGEVYRMANLQVNYTSATNASLTVSTRTSPTGIAWENWTLAGEEKQTGTSYEYKINSSIDRYLQVKLELSSSDGIYSGTVSSYTINYYSDTTPPTNASDLTAYTTATMSATITTGNWYNYVSPYFDWPDAEVTGGASDTLTGSAVDGYYVYFGTDESADPESEGSYVTSSSFTAEDLISGNSYYLRIKSKDDAGNISTQAWAPFVYKYDRTSPPAPTELTADPSGYSAVNNFDFTWSGVVDSESEIESYCYKTATASGVLASDQCVQSTTITGITGYQTGTNTFYVRSKDIAGNLSAYTTGSFYFNNGAPSAPTDLSVTPSTNTVNSFEFAWNTPSAYYGSLANLKYYYSVNALPTAASVSRAYAKSLGASSYATLPGENVLYVVVMDEAGNINYSNYSSVTFTANTTAPGVPLNADIADVSVKATSAWKLALTWEEPSSVGAGVASYQVYRSVDGESFSQRSSTSGNSFVDTGLSQQTYYYKMRACDSANNCGAFSDIVELLPDGKFVSPAPLVGEPEVADITTINASVSWVTSRSADSKISYGTASGDYFSEEVGNSDQVTAHELTLNNLSPGTTYYFITKWTDEDGNLGTSDEYSFSTEPAPSAKEVKATLIGIDTANIQFTSSHATTAKIYYGVTSAFGGYTEMGVGVAESTYTLQLTGLLDGTKYFYKISLFDSEENEYEGDVYSFETLPKPKIDLVKLQQVKGTATGTVLVTWVTNTPVSSIITYYPSSNPAAAQDLIDVKLTSAHRKVISDLLPHTAYTLVVKGRDKAGNEATSNAQTFTTSADTRPPSVANLKVEAAIEGVGEEATAQLIVSWDTDELSSSQVAYGEGSSGNLSNKTQLDTSRTYNHLMVISNLSPAKVYHLKVLSMDEADNEAQSVERVIITPKATKSALNLVVSNLSQAFGFLGGISGGQ